MSSIHVFDVSSYYFENNPTPNKRKQCKINHILDVISSLNYLYRNKCYSDITLVVHDVKFFVHKAILAARSEYFRALFFGGLSESSLSVVYLNDINILAFKHMLRYIYTGRLKVKKLQLMLDILGLAHQYNFYSLENSLSSYLSQSLNLKNIWLVFNLATMYNLDGLSVACLSFLDGLSPNPLYDSHFLSLSQLSVELLLSRDSFCAPEIEIFRFVLKWLHSVNNNQESNLSDQTLTTVPSNITTENQSSISNSVNGVRHNEWQMSMMRRCVRFELLSLAELLTEVRNSKMVDPDDLLDAINCHRTSSINELPYRGWLLPGVDLATPHFGCTLIAGDAGTYPYFFVNFPQLSMVNAKQFSNHDHQSDHNTAPSANGDENGDGSDADDAEDDWESDESVDDFENKIDDGLHIQTRKESKNTNNCVAAAGVAVFNSLPTVQLDDSLAILTMQDSEHPSNVQQTHIHVSFEDSGHLNGPSTSTLCPHSPTTTTTTATTGHSITANTNAVNGMSHSLDMINALWPILNRQLDRVSENDVVCHSLDDPNDPNIIIRLGRPTFVNSIHMRLWDREIRSYSYRIHVSLDKEVWQCVVDYRKYSCRSWQILHFPARVVQFIRITGTMNSANRKFHLITFRCWYTKEIPTCKDGFVVPNYNIATVQHGATVLEGVSRNRNALIDGIVRTYDWRSGYTCHQLGNGAIAIQLAQPFYVQSMRFLLWDLDSRKYSYAVYVSNTFSDWKLVKDARRQFCSSWQVVTFELQLVTFIRIVGSYNSANEAFHLVHLECPYPQAESSDPVENLTNPVEVQSLDDSISNASSLNNSRPSVDLT